MKPNGDTAVFPKPAMHKNQVACKKKKNQIPVPRSTSQESEMGRGGTQESVCFLNEREEWD